MALPINSCSAHTRYLVTTATELGSGSAFGYGAVKIFTSATVSTSVKGSVAALLAGGSLVCSVGGLFMCGAYICRREESIAEFEGNIETCKEDILTMVSSVKNRCRRGSGENQPTVQTPLISPSHRTIQ